MRYWSAGHEPGPPAGLATDGPEGPTVFQAGALCQATSIERPLGSPRSLTRHHRRTPGFLVIAGLSCQYVSSRGLSSDRCPSLVTKGSEVAARASVNDRSVGLLALRDRLSRVRALPESVVGEPIRRRHGVVEPPPEASYKLLEPVSTAPALDYDTSIGCRPQDNTPDVRLPGERSEAVPYRRLEGAAELVAPTPALDIDQLVALDSTQDDPVDTPPAAGAAAERHGGDRRATPLEFGPYVVAREQLVSTRAKSWLVDPRCLAAGGRSTGLARGRLALRARPRSPSARDVECRRLRGCSTAPREPASQPRRGPTCRAPLIEPQSAIAHRDPLAEQNAVADDVPLLCSAGIGRA